MVLLLTLPPIPQPLWCGSCWAHAATAVMGARWRIHMSQANGSSDFSVQQLVNCVNNSATNYNKSGACHGGSAFKAYAYAHEHGVVSSSCLAYSAKQQQCTALGICDQNLAAPSGKDQRRAVAPKLYKASEFGFTAGGPWGKTNGSGELPMMKEISARGPVSICMTTRLTPTKKDVAFDNYKGGIIASSNPRLACDHIVAVIGYGQTAAKVKYWIVQNSFGAIWGEEGFFRIKRHSSLKTGEYNLGVDSGQAAWMMP